MLSLISTLGGLLISGLPKLLEYFQNKADQKHELALAKIQTEKELQLAAQGFAAQRSGAQARREGAGKSVSVGCQLRRHCAPDRDVHLRAGVGHNQLFHGAVCLASP